MRTQKTILFVDDDAQLVSALASRARQLGLQVFTAHNALTALHTIERQRLDLICLDVQMPTANGLSIGEMLAAGPGQDVPLIVLTGMTDDATRQRCRNIGARYVAKGPNCWQLVEPIVVDLLDLEPASSSPPTVEEPDSNSLTELVFEMLGASDSLLEELSPGQRETDASREATTRPWVLCVEDDRDFSLALKLKLERHGISVVRAFEGVQGVQQAMTHPAEAVILDYNLPNGRGDYVLRRLKSNPLTKDIPVIVVSGQKNPGLEREMLHLGAARFFAKPVRFDELLNELQRHMVVSV